MLDDQGFSFLFSLPVHHEELEKSDPLMFLNIVHVRFDMFDTIDVNDNYHVQVLLFDWRELFVHRQSIDDTKNHLKFDIFFFVLFFSIFLLLSLLMNDNHWRVSPKSDKYFLTEKVKSTNCWSNDIFLILPVHQSKEEFVYVK